MPSFRFYNPAPVFMDILGLAPLSGGSLAFYQLGTTTPKPTYSDAGLTVPNQNPVPLDSSGRSNTNIWCNGSYSVALFGADGTQVWSRDIASGDGGGATIPALQSGKFLTNDGSNVLWGDVLLVPDPADSANNILSTDGSNLIWIPQQTLPDLPVENFSNRVKIGTYLRQWGSASAPASNARQTSVSVTFLNPFTGDPFFIGITPRNVTHTSGGQIGVPAIIAKSATGFSVQFDSDDFGQANASFIGALPFDWVAEGPTNA